ncbi:MAG: fused MFS/spermidine synthase [Verrucomicrobiales bacterium]|nr:fused MFS/spermidine synthase [Verrucomicrobiales bacterium]
MQNVWATVLVFLGGFAIMVLEIVGARFLAKDFGSSFYVWVSQIGVVMIALACGYYAGGVLADRFKRTAFLAVLLVPAAVLTFFIPEYAGVLVDAIITRHRVGEPIPAVWQKLDPALGSGLIFLVPCFALATLSPYMIRVSTSALGHVGRVSGWIIAASTVGSIAGVFVSGYVLIEHLTLSGIFRATGLLTAVLGIACILLDPYFRDGEAGCKRPVPES